MFKPATYEAYKLLHDGILAFSAMEAAGVKVDVEYLNNTITSTEKEIDYMNRELKNHKFYRVWKRTYGDRTKLRSRAQLGDVLFNKVGIPHPGKKTKNFKDSVDDEVLEDIANSFVQTYLKVEKRHKLLGTYFMGIRSELVNGFVHPSYLLNTTVTYRSSCCNPNFTNIPSRDPEIAEKIRRCYIPRKKNWRLGEFDFSGVEVRVGACYHKDPNMISYIKDKTRDMHRDMAAECYMLPENQITKSIRHCGKNMFVFPQFYGDWWLSCGKSMWQAIHKMDLKLVNGMPLAKHLKRKGITELGDIQDGSPTPGTFMEHMQKVEKNFWQKRFPVYADWKKSYWEKFQRRGWLKTKTGFVVSGNFRKNEVINSPIQGDAFHLDLWSIIEIDKELRLRELRTVIIGEIHDSIITDGPDEESDEVNELCVKVMTKDLVKAMPWINVPIEVEVERPPVGRSWHEKQKVTL
jgi:DNA polymerase-1